jgi:hypothetical protein
MISKSPTGVGCGGVLVFRVEQDQLRVGSHFRRSQGWNSVVSGYRQAVYLESRSPAWQPEGGADAIPIDSATGGGRQSQNNPSDVHNGWLGIAGGKATAAAKLRNLHYNSEEHF